MGTENRNDYGRDWRIPAGFSIAGLLALCTSLFFGSRGIATQDDIDRAQLFNKIAREQLWKEVNKMSDTSFCQHDWEKEEEVLDLKLREIKESVRTHMHRTSEGR